jgi:DNA-binding transcriptional LysR family regulator
LLDVITRHAPDVSLRVVPLTTRDPRRLLAEGHADMAIGYFPAVLSDLTARAQAGDTVSFLHHRLFETDYVCVMRKGHPLSKGPLTLNRYCTARHMLVSFSGRAFGFIDGALASLGRARRVVLTVNQFFIAGKVVTSSDLLTVLPRHFIDVTGFVDKLVVRELPFATAPVQVHALWHLRHDGNSAHAWLRDQVAALTAQEFAP